MLKTRSPGRRFTFLQSPKSWLISVKVTSMTCNDGVLLSRRNAIPVAKEFLWRPTWGQELSPIEDIVSRKAKYPWISRSPKEWTLFLDCRAERQKIHTGFMPLFDLKKHQNTQFWKIVSDSRETQIFGFSESLRSFLEFSPFLPRAAPVFSSIHQ